MKKIKEFIAGVLEFTTGYGFYGIGFLLAAFLLWLFGMGWLGWFFLGAFVGKNMQSIKALAGNIRL